MKTILVTGCAGFIGAATAKTLLERDQSTRVIGIDNLNDYYDVNLKKARLERLNSDPNFCFFHADLKETETVLKIFAEYSPQEVIHLAAQAGVRYSLENPFAYVDSNLTGFCNILEACRRHAVQHLVFASSSSIYGANRQIPYSVHDAADHPVSLYAATKRSNELLAHSYSHLYGLPVTGLRYFTVYGPWGRPDMAPMKFAQNIMQDKPITIYNYGDHQRDFTYIDDIVAGTLQTLACIPQAAAAEKSEQMTPAMSTAPYRIYNIGYGRSIELLRFIELLETHLGKKAIKMFAPKQPGDVDATWADTRDLEHDVGYKPKIALEEGIVEFVKWYKAYCSV